MPAGDPSPHIYEQIAGHYRDQIQHGTLSPGDRLPSNREVAEQWRVSTATVTRAMQALQTLGLVRSTQGGGTFVARSSPGGSGSIANFAGVVVRQDGTQMDTVSTFTFA